MHTLSITEQGTHVHVEGDTLRLEREQQALRQVRLGEIDQLLLLGRVEISSAALAVLARRGVDVVLLSQQGSFRAGLAGRGSRHVTLRLTQMRQALDPAFCVRVSRARSPARSRTSGSCSSAPSAVSKMNSSPRPWAVCAAG